jgi:hypothetical protein
VVLHWTGRIFANALLGATLFATPGVAKAQGAVSNPATVLVQLQRTQIDMKTDNTAALVQACLRDLEAIPGFLRANDAGLQQPVTPEEEAKRQAAFESARRQAETVQDDAQCATVLHTYLGAWRKTHLWVDTVKPDGSSRLSHISNSARMPSIELLSPGTALITIPNFFPPARQPLAALIEQHRAELERRPNWIIDVRGNGGGADTTYASLLPWLMPDGWIEVSDRIYVTPANLQAEERIAQEIAPGDDELARFAEATVRRMRSVADGHWVQQQYEEGWRHERPTVVEKHRPQRVAVLMDAGCGSSCEQFLLTVRQSFSLKLVGRSRSAGALDASNVRSHLLPSGRRRLWYATTLSNRLPGYRIEGIGISPDVFLPEPEDKADRLVDVKRTQRWLENNGW